MSTATRHVVLVTYGEPPESGLGGQLKYSWRILLRLTRTVAAIPYPLLPFIALWRAGNRSWTWSRERYESPLEPLTLDVAGGLQTALADQSPSVNWLVHVAYEFRDPLLPDVLTALPGDEPIDIVPMYVADSAFTHGIARQAVVEWAPDHPRGLEAPVRVLPQMDEEEFAEVSVRHVRAELSRLGVETGKDWALLLAAHGTLLDPPDGVETGRVATEKISQGLSRRLSQDFGMILTGWLNHARGGRWTEPQADAAMRQIAEAGYRKLIYYPFGFPTDNAETQVEGRVVLRSQPQIESIHLPCMNTSQDWLCALARLVIRESRTTV
jgi:protoheme ferro-lyase